MTEENGVVGTLCARDYKDPKCVQVGQIYPDSGNPQAGRIYDANGISPTMDTCQGGNRMPKVEVVGNYSPSGHNASRIVDTNGLAPTVMEKHGTVTAIEEVKKPTSLQRQVCETAIAKGLVKPNDIIDYTYSNSRLTEMATGG